MKKIKEIFQDAWFIYSKELVRIVKDPASLLFFIIAIFIYSFLYTMAYEKETIRNVPIAVLDQDHTNLSRQFTRMTDATEQLEVAFHASNMEQAKTLFWQGRIHGVLVIPENFEKDILLGIQVHPTIYSDVSYFLLYKQVYSGAAYASSYFGAAVQIKKLLASGISENEAMDKIEPLQVSTYNLYNPAGGYGSFVIPGIAIVILQQLMAIGICVLAGTEREQKQFLLPKRLLEKTSGCITAVLSRSSAYVSCFLIMGLFPLVVLFKWFSFPHHASIHDALLLLVPFLYAVAFLAMGISMMFKERVQAMIFIIFLSPFIVFVSGLSWPAESVPPILYSAGHLLPSTSMIPAFLKLQVMGSPLSSCKKEWLFMLYQTVIYFVFACLVYHSAYRTTTLERKRFNIFKRKKHL